MKSNEIRHRIPMVSAQPAFLANFRSLPVRSWIALLVAALVSAGCSDVVIVNDPVTHPNYVYGDENYAARNGAIRVEVVGDTFGLPQEKFADRVVTQMRAGYYRHDFFTLESSRATDPRYKIVMMFNPHASVSGSALCSASQPFPPVPRAPGERTSLLAAFCGGPVAISETNGWVALSGVDDPNFSRLIDRVTNSLFPKSDLIHGSRL